jgi:signal transduction histidine kinase
MPDALGQLRRMAGSWCGDAILALVIVMTLLSFDTATGLLSDARGQLGVACAAGVCGCLIVRRAHPSMAAAAAGVLLGVMGATGSGSGQPFTALFVAVFALAYSLGADGRLAHSGPVLLLLIAGVQLAVGQFNPFPFVAMVTAGPWVAGLVVRSRRQLTEQLTARGRELQAERELFAAESVRCERARLARELHDIVAHCVSVMVIQAGAGQRLTATDPALAAEAFDAIAEAARQAEAEIARLVELLDCDPPPCGTDWMRLVDEVVARASAAGLAVTCRFAGSFAGLAPGAAETAYRLIQESLTNALKHAPGAAADITIHGTGGHVEVSVVNGPPVAAPSPLERAGGGRGLAGMRERMAACGGDISAGPTADGGWRVLAQLPRQGDPAVEPSR